MFFTVNTLCSKILQLIVAFPGSKFYKTGVYLFNKYLENYYNKSIINK